jgi:hypothetical protein
MRRSWLVATRALMMRTRSPRSVVTTYRMRSRGDIAKVEMFSGCAMSSKSTERGSRMARAASLKETWCFLWFEDALSLCHSKSPKTTVATGARVRVIGRHVDHRPGNGRSQRSASPRASRACRRDRTIDLPSAQLAIIAGAEPGSQQAPLLGERFEQGE